jgi:dTMP kinase
MLLQKRLESEGYVVYSSEWNSSPLVHDVTKRGNKKKMLTPMTFTLIHATDNSRLKTCWPCFGPTGDD